ncbi:MAG: M14 family zinc carboxypeptidase [Mobilicoccus sp.]|nr:M14 family zinc carboxypeptidase [Mobilicoccus sp.]
MSVLPRRRGRAAVVALSLSGLVMAGAAPALAATATPTHAVTATSSATHAADAARSGPAKKRGKKARGQQYPPMAPASPECSTAFRELPISEFTSHAELGRELARIARISDGAVEVGKAGYSNRGREIWTARVGSGPKVVLLTSEIHGNEKTGTDAILDLLRFMGTSDTELAQQWRDELTIVAIPKMNPDGAELARRANDMTWAEVVARFPQLRSAEPAWNYYGGRTVQGTDYTATPGFDINRDYHPNLDYSPRAEDFPGSSADTGWYLSPETRVVRDVYRSLRNEFGVVDTYIDLHHQSPCYVMPDDLSTYVTLSLSGKFVSDPATKPGYEQYAEDYRLDYSKQLNVAAHRALQEAAKTHPVFGNVTLYNQDIDLPGTGLGSFALNGSGTVLFEMRGMTHTLGQEYRETLTEATRIGLRGILTGLASGTVEDIDPAEYDAIPETGPVSTGGEEEGQFED